MTKGIATNRAAACIVFALTCSLTWAQGRADAQSDEPVTTQHQIKVNGAALNYTARAGFISIQDEFHKTHARIFYVFYKLQTADSKTVRPLTFAWNGGPGSNSALLHVGALGPFRVKDMDEYRQAPPPYQVTENESTWLDKTDLVFVDPVGTGYSYASDQSVAKEFWSPKGDVDSITEFIRLFMAHYEYERETPIFLVGESYGTLRAAGVAGELVEKDFHVAGIVLISTVLDLHEAPSDLQFISLVPSYTAAAFIHKKLSSDLSGDMNSAIQKSEEWALSRYSVALLQGDRLAPAEREAVAKELSRFTGLSEDFVTSHNLKITMDDFSSELLRDTKQVLGHYDIRATASSTSSAGEYDPTLDPSLNTHGTGALIVPYMQSQLNFKSDASYAGPFGGRWPPPTSHRGDWMSVRWDWSEAAAVDGAASLARVMRKNKSLQVMVVSGLYDLSTPFFAAENTFAHMGLDAETRKRAQLLRYDGGHMVYLDAANRKKLKQDFTELMGRGLASASPAK
jgi:carboxypeptidase C (cathepsin A)